MAQTADVPRTRLVPLHMYVMRGASRNTLRRGGSRARLRVESRRSPSAVVQREGERATRIISTRPSHRGRDRVE